MQQQTTTQSPFEQVAQIIRSLPLEDYDRVRQILDEEEKKKLEKAEKLQRDIERWKKTDKWLQENRHNYLGQWVCLYGDELIAHGTDALEVDARAKAAGIEAPFLEHIVEQSKFYIDGYERENP